MGEKIKGTNVVAVIAPFTTDDTYATHDATYGKGGYRSVETVDDLDTIPEARRTEGMLVFVIENKKIYQLLKDSNEDWCWIEFVVGSGSTDSYTHIQSSPSDTWEIEHNLNRYPSVTITILEGGERCIAMGDVIYVDENNIQINFTSDYSGQAYLI